VSWVSSVVSPPTQDRRIRVLPAWAVAAAAEVDIVHLCEAVVARDLDAAFPGLSHDEEFVEHLRASAAENLDALQDVICGRLPLSEVRLERPLSFGAVQARLRIPQTALQRSYRVGFLAMWDGFSRALRAAAVAGDVPREEGMDALQLLADTVFGYQDHAASQVAEIYARADDALSRSRAHVRQGLIRELLRGDVTSLGPADLLTLDYALSSSHMVVLLPDLSEGAAGRLLIGLRTAAGVPRSLVHPLSMSSSALWLGATCTWTTSAIAALRAVLESTGVRASMSSPHAGLRGFRGALEEAQEVERVRLAWGRGEAPPVLAYTEVSLEVLLMRDPDRTRAFVTAELGRLAEDSSEAARLRETLEVSFQSGSHVATAEKLILHEHTVRNRLRKAEQLVGHPLHERRTELQVALRLRRLLRRGAIWGGYPDEGK
jgi:hypothetical protein